MDATIAHRLRLLVLGAAELQDGDGHELRAVLAQPRRLALLAFLALARPGAFQRRATLLGLFWPEADDAHARGALRQALHFLRQEMGADALPGRGDEVSLATDACWCDAVALENAAAVGDAETVIALYRGDLLDGLIVDGAPTFDEWLELRRARLSRAYDAALEQVAIGCASNGERVRAVECWRTLVERAPLRSRAVLGLMQALANIDDAVGALSVAAEHRARMARELGAAPDARVLALAARLRGPR